MSKFSYHPKAFLLHTKNIKPGLIARTKISFLLDEKPLKANTISERTGIGYFSVLYHLNLMEKESLVDRINNRPYFWKLTNIGQTRLLKSKTSINKNNLIR